MKLFKAEDIMNTPINSYLVLFSDGTTVEMSCGLLGRINSVEILEKKVMDWNYCEGLSLIL